MLLIAIVSLQFILLQYSCAPFVLTKKLYIYIYMSSCTWTLNLQKTQLMNCGNAKKSHMNHTCKHNLTKHLTILPLCTQQVGPKG